MNKQTAALIALYAGWMLTADTAHATAYEDIAGQWCGDVTDYVFAPNTLTVKFHDDRPANVFKITQAESKSSFGVRCPGAGRKFRRFTALPYRLPERHRGQVGAVVPLASNGGSGSWPARYVGYKITIRIGKI
jgi:hypothetical protein